jgi:glycosyltransferase involved in cell wall biosynthesis
LSIVAIAKNEGSYILEWVSYHKAIGVDHIYIYDNGSTDSTVNVIRKFIDDGYVTLIEYPGDKMQLKAYNNAIDTFANNSAYIAFIDCDEFLVADGDIKSKVECIFNTNHKVGSVTLNWAMFGSDGYESRPEGLVI